MSSPVMVDITYTARQRRPQPFMFAWCLQSIRLHLENIIHGIAWQIIYLLGYCSKFVSRWGFRFSILSQRKMNKEHKASKIPHPSSPTSRCPASAVCALHLYTTPAFLSSILLQGRDEKQQLLCCQQHPDVGPTPLPVQPCVLASPGFLHRTSAMAYLKTLPLLSADFSPPVLNPDLTFKAS